MSRDETHPHPDQDVIDTYGITDPDDIALLAEARDSDFAARVAARWARGKAIRVTASTPDYNVVIARALRSGQSVSALNAESKTSYDVVDTYPDGRLVIADRNRSYSTIAIPADEVIRFTYLITP